MSIKSLLGTTIIGAPTTTTIYTLEPLPKVQQTKQDLKDCGTEIKGIVKDAKENVRAHKAKKKKTIDISDNVKLNKGKIGHVVGTSIATGATTSTTTVGNAINNHYMDQIHHKNLSTYVNSMSEEELTEALERLDLLDSEDNSKTYSKTR
jgi:hypothetical protein